MNVLTTIENPYWDEVAELFTLPPMSYGDDLGSLAWRHRIDAQIQQFRARDDFVRRYAWAVSDPASLDFVAEWLGERAIEIGAGTGYWAWQLAQRGTDIIAVDDE
jgi:2-polyprenyl-3-methyl-5-hydroxy-6-metoxy-1,4-benzoquinol methylase